MKRNITFFKKKIIKSAIVEIGSADDLNLITDRVIEKICNLYDDSKLDYYLKKLDMLNYNDVYETVKQYVSERENNLYLDGYLTEYLGLNLS